MSLLLPYEEIDYACCECGCMAEHLWGTPPPLYPLCIVCATAEAERDLELTQQINEHLASGGVFCGVFKQAGKLEF